MLFCTGVTLFVGEDIDSLKSVWAEEETSDTRKGGSCIRRPVATCNFTKWYESDVIRVGGVGGLFGIRGREEKCMTFCVRYTVRTELDLIRR